MLGRLALFMVIFKEHLPREWLPAGYKFGWTGQLASIIPGFPTVVRNRYQEHQPAKGSLFLFLSTLLLGICLKLNIVLSFVAFTPDERPCIS